jgi:HEAT repeat protein
MSPSEKEKLTQRLVHQLRGHDQAARVQAAIRLSEMGPEARPVLADVIGALQHHDAAVRKVAAWVLGYVGEGVPEAVRALDRAQGDSDPAVRKAARAALTVSGLRRAA